MRKGKLLIIDDDLGVLYTAKMILKSHYETVITESNPVAAIDKLKKQKYDIVILDMNFRSGATSGAEGIDWLKKIIELQPDVQVIMDTAYGDISLAVESMREGAIDFLTKPWEKEKLLATVNNAYNLSLTKKEVKSLQLKQKILLEDFDQEFEEIIGNDDSVVSINNIIKKVAPTDANILILGENGTGKELVARQIHRQSNRSKQPFIKVDLGAIPETLFESELFGHTKGAFTDAKESRAGRFELAEGGTLFLDEIGNLNLRLQAKLLSVIQSKQISPLGSAETIRIDTRLICATNKNLTDEVNDGLFRQDLLYRINTVEVEVPALKNRIKDIPLLVQHFLQLYQKKYHKQDLTFNENTRDTLKSYPWPGNIRELRHAVERAVIMSDDNKLMIHHFLTANDLNKILQISTKDSQNINDLEKRTIVSVIGNCKGNFSKAAQELGMGRTTLYRKIKKYNLKF